MYEKKLESSLIDSASYNKDNSSIKITWKNKSTTTFSGATYSTFLELVNSPSPGKYYHQFLKNSYQAT